MHVRIDPATETVEVNGCDVSAAVRRVSVDVHRGRPPEVFLEIATGALVPDVLNLDGIVHVITPPTEIDLDPREYIAAWLESLDPGVVEREVLNDADLGTGTGVAFLKILAGMARG